MKHLHLLVSLLTLAILTVVSPARGSDPETIRLVLVGLPGVVDEDHLSTVALGIAHGADRLTTCEEEQCKPEWRWGRQELVASLITMGYWESRFIRRIGEGKCRKWECDATKLPDGRIVHLARGFYQVQASGLVTRAQWRGMVGIEYDAQVTAAEVSGRIMARNRARCGSRGGMISAYATGIGCSWRGSGVRELFLRRVLDRLKAAEAAQAAAMEASS